MRRIETEVAIIGGGCTGLWVSYELARFGSPAVVLEYGPFAQYASQRNQGWLHTGSLYAASVSENPDRDGTEMFHLARTCLQASVRLRRFAKRHAREALNNGSSCLYLYSDFNEELARRTQERLRELGLEPRWWSGSVDLIEPILGGSSVSIALETPDIPMDCGKLLSAVLRRSLRLGTQCVHSSSEMSQWKIFRANDRWITRGSDFEVSSSMLIVTSGPLIATMSLGDRIFPEVKPDLQRSIVAIINRKLCNRMLVFRDEESHYLNLTPFSNLTTINLGAKDTAFSDSTDPAADNIGDGERDVIAGALDEYCPQLLTGRATIPAHFYQCQKVANSIPGSRPEGRTAPRHYFWRWGGDRLYYLYSGKFTLGLSAAHAFVQDIREELTVYHSPKHRIPRRTIQASIGPSPYRRMATHFLGRDATDALKFYSRVV